VVASTGKGREGEVSKVSNRDDLLKILNLMSQPKKYGLTQEALGQTLINFCAKCPDPVRARWLIVECRDPMTDEQPVDRALNMPVRPMTDVPTSIVPADHPVRMMA
jgi:hypothetical protein